MNAHNSVHMEKEERVHVEESQTFQHSWHLVRFLSTVPIVLHFRC